MKTKTILFAAVVCLAVCSTSCSSDDEEISYNNEAVALTSPKYAAQAASFTISEGVKATSGDNTYDLTAINITESGKAIIEVSDAGGSKKYATYNVDINGDTYTITDNGGVVKGTVKVTDTRATSEAGMTITLTVEIPGVGTLRFSAANPVGVQKMVETAVSTATANIARTWTVHEMKLTLEGDVSASVNEKSGNMGAFVDEVQERGAELSEGEMAALRKTINSITLDKSGMFAIEYGGDGGTEACNWKWTDDKQSELTLNLRNSEFGNKFLSDNSNVEVRFFASGVAHFIMTTDITGNKNYTATLLMVLE